MPAPDRPIVQLELWVDGELLAYAQPDQPFTWDTQSMDDGFHELRLVAQEAGPIETRSYARFGVILTNSGHRLELDSQQQRVRYGETITVSGAAVGGREAAIWQGNRKLASVPVKDGSWRLQIDSQMLGVGPVSLGVRVTFGDNTVVRSAPLKIDITPPEFAGKATGSHRLDAGKPETAGTEGNHTEVKPIKLNGKLRNLKDVQHLTMAGAVYGRSAPVFLNSSLPAREKSASLSMIVPCCQTQTMDRKQTRFFPLALEHGPHDLKIEFSPADSRPYLKLVLEGDQVATIPEVRVVSDIHKQENVTP